MVKRFENWDKLLSDYLQEMRNVPFKWGQNDCILFAAKGYERLTGVNEYSSYLGYKSKTAAYKIIKENGGLEAIMCKHFGGGHRNILKAKRGDLVLVKDTETRVGMIDDTGQSVVIPGDEGLIKEPLSRAWRVWSY